MVYFITINDTRRNVSEHICSVNIHIISDYDSITLNIGVIRNNDKQLKKEKQQLFKLRKNIHFQHYNYNTVFCMGGSSGRDEG